MECGLETLLFRGERRQLEGQGRGCMAAVVGGARQDRVRPLRGGPKLLQEADADVLEVCFSDVPSQRLLRQAADTPA